MVSEQLLFGVTGCVQHNKQFFLQSTESLKKGLVFHDENVGINPLQPFMDPGERIPRLRAPFLEGSEGTQVRHPSNPWLKHVEQYKSVCCSPFQMVSRTEQPCG